MSLVTLYSLTFLHTSLLDIRHSLPDSLHLSHFHLLLFTLYSSLTTRLIALVTSSLSLSLSLSSLSLYSSISLSLPLFFPLSTRLHSAFSTSSTPESPLATRHSLHFPYPTALLYSWTLAESFSFCFQVQQIVTRFHLLFYPFVIRRSSLATRCNSPFVLLFLPLNS